MANKFLLIAENNEDDYLQFQKSLEKVSPSTGVHRVKTGEEMLAYLYSHSIPDLIVVNLHNMNISGVEVLMEMANKPLLKAVPLVFLSDAKKPTEKSGLKTFGLDGYYARPMGHEEAVGLIKEFVRFGLEIAP